METKIFDEKKIIERIRKILTLADSEGATEAEIENAMEKAHSMLAKYNLNMEKIKHEEPTISMSTIKTFSHNWCISMHNSIGYLYFTKFVHGVGPKTSRTTCGSFIGTQLDIEIAVAVAQYATQTLHRMALKERQNQLNIGLPVNGFYTSFLNGAAIRIRDRVTDIIEAKKNSQNQEEQTMALAIIDLHKDKSDKNMIELHKFIPNIKSKPTRLKSKVPYGTRIGYDKAGDVNLNPRSKELK